jgi:hypothetical protein
MKEGAQVKGDFSPAFGAWLDEQIRVQPLMPADVSTQLKAVIEQVSEQAG